MIRNFGLQIRDACFATMTNFELDILSFFAYCSFCAFIAIARHNF